MTISPVPFPPPRNLCELLLRDVASLLITSHLVARSVHSLRQECGFPRDLAASLGSLAATSAAGESLLHEPLAESGAILPATSATADSALLTEYFVRVPPGTTPGIMAAEVAANLRMLAQHIEFRIRLAAEEALLIGQNAICHALMIWAAEWRACGRALRAITARARAKAYFADLTAPFMPQGI